MVRPETPCPHCDADEAAQEDVALNPIWYAGAIVGTVVAAVSLVVRWSWKALMALSEREPF